MEHEYEMILSELANADRKDGLVQTVTGQHESYGLTALVRDGLRFMALVDHPAHLDRFLAEQAFLRHGAAAMVTGRG